MTKSTAVISGIGQSTMRFSTANHLLKIRSLTIGVAIDTAAIPTKGRAFSVLAVKLSTLLQMGAENSSTPNTKPIKARHFVAEYCRCNRILEKVAVVKILHCAITVKTPAPILTMLL